LILFVAIGAASARAELILERKFSLGGWLTGGNSRVQSLHGDLYLDRNHKLGSQITLKGSFAHESSGGTDTLFKIYSSLRYSRSLSRTLYYFYKLEAEHDRFQDIDLRAIPTVGIGYWFVNEDELKSMVEGAVGYQREYTIDRTADELVVLKLSHNLFLGPFSNDLDIYAAADDPDNYRFVNQMDYKVKLNSYYAFKWRLKDEYNNRPAAGVEKNDVHFSISLEYAFKKKWQ
jgi:putative salt-induced outer membrane protein YdiY